jgi:hypothetical protein
MHRGAAKAKQPQIRGKRGEDEVKRHYHLLQETVQREALVLEHGAQRHHDACLATSGGVRMMLEKLEAINDFDA